MGRFSAAALLVVALLCAAHMVAASYSSTWPPNPDKIRYCNRSPPPIPPLSSDSKGSNPKLVQAQVLVRHGDRTLAWPKPCWNNDKIVYECTLSQLQDATTDDTATTADLGRVYRQEYEPNREYLPGNCAVGQLTAEGRAQHLINGAHVRDAYVYREGLLPERFNEAAGTVFLRSDDSIRTKMSGQALFDGLYPPHPSDDDSIVVPWYTRDETVDDIQPNAFNCPNLTPAIAAAAASDRSKALQADINAFLAKARVALNSTSDDLVHLFDCSYQHLCRQAAFPAGMTQEFHDQMVNLTTLMEADSYTFNNSRVARLGMGPLIAELRGNIQSILNGSAHANRFYLYAGHDLGPMMPLLAAFGVFDGLWCPYAGLISLELYSTDSGHAVRMVYQGQVMKIPGCGSSELCDISTFESVLERIIPSHDECYSPQFAS